MSDGVKMYRHLMDILAMERGSAKTDGKELAPEREAAWSETLGSAWGKLLPEEKEMVKGYAPSYDYPEHKVVDLPGKTTPAKCAWGKFYRFMEAAYPIPMETVAEKAAQ